MLFIFHLSWYMYQKTDLHDERAQNIFIIFTNILSMIIVLITKLCNKENYKMSIKNNTDWSGLNKADYRKTLTRCL